MAKKVPLMDYSKNEFAHNLKEMYHTTCQKYGEKIFLTWRNGEVFEHLSFFAYEGKINAFGTALWAMGYAGKRVAIIGPTRWEYITSYLAVTSSGGTIIPLDKELQPDQVKGFIELSEADAVIFSSDFKDMILSFMDGTLTKSPLLIGMDEPTTTEDIKSYSELVAMGQELVEGGQRGFLDIEIDNESMAALLFTSGTTGTSKGVMLSHKNIATNAYYAGVATIFNSKMDMMSVLPIHHTYENVMAFFAAFMLGTHINICESVKMVMRSFKIFKPNAMTLVPLFVETMYKKIWDEIEKKGKTKTVKSAIKASNAMRKVGIDMRRKLFKDVLEAFGGNLNVIICGGAPLNPDTIKGFEAFGIDIFQGYGITECSPLVAVMPQNIIKPASVGYPVPCVEVIIDKTEGEETGEILVKGDSVMIGYINNPEATAEVMTEDGFFRTGDIGYLDEDGFLYITGRKKNVVVLNNGKNIFPEEIEEHLSKCELMAEKIVIGRTLENGTVILTALVYPNLEKFTDKDGNVRSSEEMHDAIKAEVMQINKTLPSFKHITEIELLETEFEKNTSKKIKRFLYQ